MEQAVGSGDLSPGDVLPPLRELAVYLEVNPNTVASAYRTLRDRGVIETAGRRGSRVRQRPSTTPREALRVPVAAGVRDLADGNPAPELLPDLGPALTAAARHARAPTLYGAPAVTEGLTELAHQTFEADGVAAGRLAVTSGSLDAIERVLAAHLRPGDAVAVEDPGWGSLLDLVPALGLRPAPVGVDEEGPVPEEVERALAGGARALVLTSRAQNPTGAAIGAKRAGDLRKVLGGHPRVLLIEDDHGHGIVDLPFHPVAGEGVTEHWVTLRSVAKVYGPDLRLALMVGDAVTVDRVRGRLRLGPGWVSHLLQDTVVELWRSGAVDRGRVAGEYGARRTALVNALAERGVAAYGRSGLNVWVPVPDEMSVVTSLVQAGWAVAPGARFRLRSPQGIRVTVSRLTEADIPLVADAVATATSRRGEARRYD